MISETLHDYTKEFPELLNEVVVRSNNMLVFSLADGRIIWANEAFCIFIGYTLHEFTRANNPILWTDISVNDASLASDIHMVEEIVQCKRDSYTIRKMYTPKNGNPVLVKLYVRRYPPSMGEKLAMFIVEVEPVGGTNELALKEYVKNTALIATCLSDLKDSQLELVKTLKIGANTGLNSVVSWLVGHPVVGVPVSIILSLLLFGERIGELVQSFFK